MERLTKDDVKQMGMTDLARNQVFIKDGEAWCRDFEREISARDFIREICKLNGIKCSQDTDDFDEDMMDMLQYSTDTIEGVIAIFYTALWGFAEVRENLKAYEDTGLTPEEFTDLQSCLEDEAGTGGAGAIGLISDLIELMKYRKLEAEGRLIKLPCDEGNTIQSQHEAAESMLNDIYQGGIIGETAYNVINQALENMKEIIIEREGME